jgi:STE24 endopeptidase
MARAARGTLLLGVLALAVLLVAVLLGVAAWGLWQTDVPDGLRLPEVDASAVLESALLEEARDYERFLRISFLVSLVVVIAVFAFYARFGARFVRESAAGRIGTGMLLGMLGLAILWLVQTPFGLLDHWWQRRHDVSELGYGDWLILNWFALGGEFLFVCLALLIVMGLAGPLGFWWWIPGGLVFTGLVALFTFVSPYMIPAQEKPPQWVVEDSNELAERQGLAEIPVRVQEVESWEAPNAAATGLGPTRRIILWDTMLTSFGGPEIRAVLAHELGHHSRNHLWKNIGWYALFAIPGALLIALITNRRGGMREPLAVPLALLVLVVLQTFALPVQNAITRHMEEEADWVALETTEDPDGVRRLFEGFAEEALIDPDPPRWSYYLMETHPVLADRVAMAEAWRDRQQP